MKVSIALQGPITRLRAVRLIRSLTRAPPSISDFNQFFHDGARIDLNCFTYVYQLNRVQASFASLVVRHERLWPLQLSRNFLLLEPGGQSAGLKQFL